MNTKKSFFFSVLLNTSFLFSMTTPSWFSPTNWAYQKYKNSVDYLKNMWVAKQIQAIAAKTTSAQKAEEKWSPIYQKKESFSKKPITLPELSAKKFKSVIQEISSNVASDNIMSRFKNHPENFLFGASSSSYQYEGGLDVLNENGKTYRNANAQFYAHSDPQLPLAGNAIEFFDRYKSDIKQMKDELGINAFRLSIAWDRVEPKPGQYDQNAIDTYIDIIKTLIEHNIEPIVVLHHYTVPTWFLDKGGFAKKENINDFVEFAKTMYVNLYKHVTYWSTFNAIEGYAFKGYRQLDGPPGTVASMYTTQQVMAHMLEAHVRFYQAIKNKETGLYYEKLKENKDIPDPQIGIQKNIVILDAAARTSINVADVFSHLGSAAISVIGEGAQNKGFFNFFTTGTFNVFTPRQVYYHNEKAPESIDWIGLNVYSNMLMKGPKPQDELNKDKATANKNYRDYPEGIYRAAEEIYKRIAQPLGIPIIITENGIATDDDAKRTRFFQRALFTIRMLIKEGYPIIGYTPWASHDNYEWPTKDQPEPFSSRRYGFFHVDFDKDLKRTLKEGAHYYRDFIKTYFNPKLTLPTKQPKYWKE